MPVGQLSSTTPPLLLTHYNFVTDILQSLIKKGGFKHNLHISTENSQKQPAKLLEGLGDDDLRL